MNKFSVYNDQLSLLVPCMSHVFEKRKKTVNLKNLNFLTYKL